MTALDPLLALLRNRRICLLTGAGISTDSGIPDYRGPTAPKRRRAPIQHRDFVHDPRTRARYWARSVLGWPRFRDFRPNAAHLALSEWEKTGGLSGLITQNVDRLHQKAGHRDVLELHGALAWVRCLGCQRLVDRDSFQQRLLAENPRALEWQHTLLPDGDADLPDDAVAGFVVPGCQICGGVYKPDVVFFGDSVPRPRVEAAWAQLDAAQALLVVGSSLTVFSGYRFVLRAKEQGKPVAVVNLGPTRADADAAVRLEAPLGEVLPELVARLRPPRER